LGQPQLRDMARPRRSTQLQSLAAPLVTCTLLLACTPTRDALPVASTTPPAAERWCDHLPRAGNAAMPRVRVATDWFEVYRVATGVFALVESRQFQETISYLIVGERGALLFDTGLGVVPIHPVVEELTSLPVRVLNSHTHYDHVGGNWEFADILARDTPYTRANQRGFPHEELAGEVAAESFCGAPPPALDTAMFYTRSWKATRTVADGDTIDLGGRVLRVVAVPGHTPDAVALLDSARGLLWTGDTYYDAPVWLYVPETDLDAYERSIDRLTQLAPSLTRLLPAHNIATAEPTRLAEMKSAIRAVRDGKVRGTVLPPNRVEFRFDHFAILTSQPLLDGRTGDRSRGGSGLTSWK
jgi:glyoxylase-like metal-dependent hydrolase (beta-lactamase superfamily II)